MYKWHHPAPRYDTFGAIIFKTQWVLALDSFLAPNFNIKSNKNAIFQKVLRIVHALLLRLYI